MDTISTTSRWSGERQAIAAPCGMRAADAVLASDIVSPATDDRLRQASAAPAGLPRDLCAVLMLRCPYFDLDTA